MTYLSTAENTPQMERICAMLELDADEIEAIVGRFNRNSHRAGQLRGKVTVVKGKPRIESSFGNKILWEKS